MGDSSGPFPRLVYTVALAALASTSYADAVFSEVNMTVTRCCFQEILRGADDADSRVYRESCQEARSRIQRNRGQNVSLHSTSIACRGPQGYLKDNIGEISIARALEADSGFKLVVSFDDDVIDGPGGISEELKNMFRQDIPTFDVFPANEPLYRLYKQGRLEKDDFEDATREMIGNMDWDSSSSSGLFWIAYPEYSAK